MNARLRSIGFLAAISLLLGLLQVTTSAKDAASNPAVNKAAGNNAGDKPVATIKAPKTAAAKELAPDGRELFSREWLAKDARAHGGDGLGPVFNESSCVACHNQGGVGGAGSADKNVDIMTAFPLPQQLAAPPQANNGPERLFQSLFGALAPPPATQPTPDGGKPVAMDAKAFKAQQKEELKKLHPGFLSSRSLVLHHAGLDPKYADWRETMLNGQFAQQQAVMTAPAMLDRSAPPEQPAPDIGPAAEPTTDPQRTATPAPAASNKPAAETPADLKPSVVPRPVENIDPNAAKGAGDKKSGSDAPAQSNDKANDFEELTRLITSTIQEDRHPRSDETPIDTNLKVVIGPGQSEVTEVSQAVVPQPVVLGGIPMIQTNPESTNSEIASLQNAARRNMNTGFTFQSGTVQISRSQRNAIALFGIGKIDAIPEKSLMELAKVERDKFPDVAGRPSKQKDGHIGRFGWKAQKATLEDFALTACAIELGLNVPGHEQSGVPLDPKYKAPGLDMDRAECDALVAFLKRLPTPVERKAATAQEAGEIDAGRKHFVSIGCANCHVQKLDTVDGLYSDLLLHDMGPELSDTGNYGVFTPDQPEEEQDQPLAPDQFAGVGGPTPKLTPEQLDKIVGAMRQEWRTPPLWGVRDSGPYLHDGRASTLEQAIAFHGGQGAKANLKFFALKPEERRQVMTFLKSLTAPEPRGADLAMTR